MAEAKAIIGTSETHPDIRWATGFAVGDPVAYAHIGETRYLFASALEFTRAKDETFEATVLPLEDYAREGRKRVDEKTMDMHVLALHALFLEHGVQGLRVPQDFPYEAGKLFEKLGYDVAVQPAPFYEERSVKSREEVKAIRQVVGYTEEAIGLAADMIRKARVRPDKTLLLGKETLTSERLKEAMSAYLFTNECLAVSTIVAVGEQGAQPHNEGTGPLRAGALIVIDIFPRSAKTGYHADITRTFIKDEPTERQAAMYAAVLEAQHAAENAIRAGVIAKEPHDVAAAVFKRHGFGTTLDGEQREGFIHGLGHGLGLEVHEPPRLNAVADRPLVRGNVVTVEPGLYYREIGGVRIEDDVVVTDGGCENLCSFPKDDWIIP